ncbi:hypothetical protein [Halodesulfovibrio sp.]|jgi:5-methylcytosine-specific restriction endonuclease McrA|uniref:hypothetical protein n=1 Tax=Halodesulfovibrio sp. TaxID=1912772 RepID=UPI0025D2E2EB|nr:hypothetical protein [Halodesulfovibrio sp.]MCT4625692.1 hypothetical protein [Halodesulfovibrio sp.]
MNKLPRPSVDDKKLIEDLANNTRLTRTTYPHLKEKLKEVIEQYQFYEDQCGNALQISNHIIPDQLKNGLIKHYNSPPKSLTFIDNLRKSSPDSCPMCGSFHSSTLDHLLPKENYPLWSIYSKNLVPACQCNSKRGETLLGNRTKGERVLHPYFDECLSLRIITCEITSNDQYKTVEIKLKVLPIAHENQNAFEFHLKEIVCKSGLVEWLKNKWGKLYRKPSAYFHGIKGKQFDNVENFKTFINDYREWTDENHGGKNNWDSILITGILSSDDIIEWLFNRHNGIETGQIDPLD